VVEQEKRVLEKAHLRKAMGSLEHPITFKQSDKTEVLIQNVVESMRMREVAPSSLGQVSKVSRVSEGSEEDDDINERGKKKTKVEPKKAVVAVLDTTAQHVSEDPSRASIAALPTGPPHPASDKETGAFGSQHLACVLSAAIASLKDMKELVAYAKTKSDMFKAGVPLSCKSDGGAYNKVQLAESIAKCRPNGVTTAHELLSWLMVSAAE